LPLLLH